MKMKENKTNLIFCLLLSIPVIITAAWGIFKPAVYGLETENWKVQAIAQDMVDLYLIVPVLLVSAYYGKRGARFFQFINAGAVLFLVYTYAIYCFSVHFNSLFILYCLVFGASVYAFIYFLSSHSAMEAKLRYHDKAPVKLIAAFFMLVGISFYFLWLSEITPAAMDNSTPASLIETGLLTNPVHVLDLSVFLPGMIMVSVLLLRGKPVAYLLTPVLLVFCILMDINIAILIVMMKLKGLEGSFTVAAVMGLLAVLSGILFHLFLSAKTKPAAG
jgi:hypothetical protein